MDEADIIQHVSRLRERIRTVGENYSDNPLDIDDLYDSSRPRPVGVQAEVVEFLKIAAGHKSQFVLQAQTANGAPKFVLRTLDAVLEGFLQHVSAGLQSAVSPRRQAQIDVVSDLLEQADALLQKKGVHAAAPIMLIGATLEEYLRTTVEKEGLSLGNRKPGLQSYADILRDANVLSKQDVKDITSWAGMRNHAAHGEWDKVRDPERAKLMLQGVNLFLRQRGA